MDRKLVEGASSEQLRLVTLPKGFRDFCLSHGLNIDLYEQYPVDVFPRFIRVSRLRSSELPVLETAAAAAASCSSGSLATHALPSSTIAGSSNSNSSSSISFISSSSAASETKEEGGLVDEAERELQALRLYLGPSVRPVQWASRYAGGVYTCDGRTSLASSLPYRSALIYGMDAASAASVFALSPQPGEAILDLCAAPGAKLCMIAEAMGCRGSLVGVDASPLRLRVAARLLRKYRLSALGRPQQGWRVRLFGGDGCTWDGKAGSRPDFRTGEDGVFALRVGHGCPHHEEKDGWTAEGEATAAAMSSSTIASNEGPSSIERSAGKGGSSGVEEVAAREKSSDKEQYEGALELAKAAYALELRRMHGGGKTSHSQGGPLLTVTSKVGAESASSNGAESAFSNGAESTSSNGAVTASSSTPLTEDDVEDDDEEEEEDDKSSASSIATDMDSLRRDSPLSEVLCLSTTVTPTNASSSSSSSSSNTFSSISLSSSPRNSPQTLRTADATALKTTNVSPLFSSSSSSSSLSSASSSSSAAHPPYSTSCLLLDSLHDNLFGGNSGSSGKVMSNVSSHRLALQMSVAERFLPEEHGKLSQDGARNTGASQLFDRVLIDAECTHDGSLKHIQKYSNSKFGGVFDNWLPIENRLADDPDLIRITLLQLNLLRNGFRLLKPGGTMVYSTCSLTRAQNEGVVETFLSEEPFAAINPLVWGDSSSESSALPMATREATSATANSSHPLPSNEAEWDTLREKFAALHDSKTPPFVSGRGLPGTCRLEPLSSGCGGLFIARLVKKI